MNQFENENEKKNQIKFIVEVCFSCSLRLLTYTVKLKSCKFQVANLI